MNWDDLTEEQRHAAVTAVARVENNSGECSCSSCMVVYAAMAKAVVESLPSPTAEMVPWEPRRDVPTAEQANAWYQAGHYWMVATVERDDPFITREAPTDGKLIEWCLPWRSGFPVSWTEVEAAVVAAQNGMSSSS